MAESSRSSSSDPISSDSLYSGLKLLPILYASDFFGRGPEKGVCALASCVITFICLTRSATLVISELCASV